MINNNTANYNIYNVTNDDVCSICLDPMKNTDCVAHERLGHLHAFHRSCAKASSAFSNKCPTCGTSMDNDSLLTLKDFTSEEFNATKQDPSSLPHELVLKVFSHLNLATHGKSRLVSKGWNQFLAEPTLWKIVIYREIAFGNDKWAQRFGKDVVKDEDSKEEFSSFPLNDFIADCKKFKSIFPEKNAKDSLMLVRLPKTLNGQLTLKSLGELVKKYFSDSNTCYRFIWPGIVDELGDKSIDKSRWVLMTKDVLPGSRNKSYGEQQKIVAELAKKSLISYEVPDTLESAACILSQYFDSNIHFFNDGPYTYTRCKDKVQGFQAVVGGFGPAVEGFGSGGLYVGCNSYGNDNCLGVAALRKF
jgi:F-box domain/Ring finger domain